MSRNQITVCVKKSIVKVSSVSRKGIFMPNIYPCPPVPELRLKNLNRLLPLKFLLKKIQIKTQVLIQFQCLRRILKILLEMLLLNWKLQIRGQRTVGNLSKSLQIFITICSKSNSKG